MNTTCICILNYNNGPKTVTCISSVLKQTLEDWHILIIDNYSTDDSIDFIRNFHDKEPSLKGKVNMITSDSNDGYSGGNNLGMKLAKSFSIFSFLLIINNDVELKENFLEEMINRYEDLRRTCKTTKIALGATETGVNGIVHHNGFHYIHLLSGITFSKPLFPSFKYIVGSSIFMDIRAPLMDESFFLYFDDVQYSKILRRKGYILESSPRSFFIHEVGGTVKQNIEGLILKSLLRFYFLNYPYLLPLVIPVRLILILYLRIKNILFK